LVGWLKVNIDGATRDSLGFDAYVKIFRGRTRYVGVFFFFPGVNLLFVEFVGAILAIEHAEDNGYR